MTGVHLTGPTCLPSQQDCWEAAKSRFSILPRPHLWATRTEGIECRVCPRSQCTGAEQGPSGGSLTPLHVLHEPSNGGAETDTTSPHRTPIVLQRNRVELPVSGSAYIISPRKCWPLSPFHGRIPEVSVVQPWECSEFGQVV